MAEERFLEDTASIRDIRARLIRTVLQFPSWEVLALNTTSPVDTVAEIVTDLGTHLDPVTGLSVSNSGRFQYVTQGWARRADATGSAEALEALADPVRGGKLVAFRIGKSMSQKAEEQIALDDARTTQASDQDNIALKTLINDGYRNIKLRGGKGVGTQQGEYPIGTGPWSGTISGQPITGSTPFSDLISNPGNLALANGKPANGLRLIGDGMERTRIKQTDNYAFLWNVRSDVVADNLKGFTIEEMTLEGLGGAANQNGHILAMYGVSGFRARRAMFYRMSSDGAFFSKGPKPGDLALNDDIGFDDCDFDGFDKENRQGISFEDCLNWYVDKSRFKRLSNPSDTVSVAAIDVEPISAKNYRNGTGRVTNCTFTDLGNAAVAFYVNSPTDYDYDPQMFTISGNQINGAKRGFDFSGATNGEIDSITAQHLIDVFGNKLRNVSVIMRAQGIHGLDYHDNQHEDVGSLYIGDQGLGKGCKNINIRDNSFVRAGLIAGPVIMIDDKTRNVGIKGNVSIDSGRSDGLGGWFALFRNGTDHQVRLDDNTVVNNNGRMKAFAQMSDGVTINDAYCSKNNNAILGTAMVASDNFSPSAKGGLIGYGPALAAEEGLYGSPKYFDVTVPGAAAGMAWKVTCNFQLKDMVEDGAPATQQGFLQLSAQTFVGGAVRVQVANTNSNNQTNFIRLPRGFQVIVTENK